jgi:hypothetical protein
MEFRTIKLQLTFYKIIIMSSLLYSPLLIKRLKSIAISLCVNTRLSMALRMIGLVHLGSRAAGGAGLIIQEATSVSEGRISQKISALEGTHRKISANKSIYCESKFSSWNSIGACW